MKKAPRWIFLALGAVVLGGGAVALRLGFPQAADGGTLNTDGAGSDMAASATATTTASATATATGSGDPGAVDSGAPDAGDPDAAAPDEPEPKTLAEQRERLFALLIREGMTADEVAKVRAIFEASPDLSQGNPAVTVHPMTRAECRRRRSEAKLAPDQPALCGEKYMVPAHDPSAGETPETAKVCVDQYEFPGVPCEYPVVHVRASEAAAICRAVGKRLCDAHEWEGACAGAVRAPEVEYSFKHDRHYSSGMHNLKRELVWAYGPKKNHGLCGTTSFKTKDCPGGGWKQCGSNTFPTGAFPECKSPSGAYDIHGNAAEHMNFPMKADQLGAAGGTGETEMKGSWFIFSSYEAHPDDCRWRAPDWHGTKLMDRSSHANYHLGFRCCKDVEPEAPSR